MRRPRSGRWWALALVLAAAPAARGDGPPNPGKTALDDDDPGIPRTAPQPAPAAAPVAPLPVPPAAAPALKPIPTAPPALPPAVPAPAAPTPAATAAPVVEARAPKKIPTLGLSMTIAGGVVAVVGAALAADGGLRFAGANLQPTLDQRNQQGASARTEQVAAGVTLGVGLAAVALGVWDLVRPRRDRVRPVAFAAPGAAGFAVGGEFR